MKNATILIEMSDLDKDEWTTECSVDGIGSLSTAVIAINALHDLRKEMIDDIRGQIAGNKEALKRFNRCLLK